MSQFKVTFTNMTSGLCIPWSTCNPVWIYFIWEARVFKICFPCGLFLKGNPNSQGILNSIIQMLQYYYQKQHKNIINSQIIEQNLVISLCPSLFTVACAFFAFLAEEFFFQFFKRHKWSFVKYIVLFFLVWKWFSPS